MAWVLLVIVFLLYVNRVDNLEKKNKKLKEEVADLNKDIVRIESYIQDEVYKEHPFSMPIVMDYGTKKARKYDWVKSIVIYPKGFFVNSMNKK